MSGMQHLRILGLSFLVSTIFGCGNGAPKADEEGSVGRLQQQLGRWTVPPSNGVMVLVAGDGSPGKVNHANPLSASFNDPAAVLPIPPSLNFPQGIVYVADWGNNSTRAVTHNGVQGWWGGYSNLLLNSRAEMPAAGNAVPSWQTLVGTWTTPGPCSSAGLPCGIAADGNRYFCATQATSPRLYQDVPVHAQAFSIDHGFGEFCFTGMLRSVDKPTPDYARVKIDAIDVSGNYTANGVADTGATLHTAGWSPVELNFTVPKNTRVIRVNLVPKRRDGSGLSPEAFFDGLQLAFGACNDWMLPQSLASTPRVTVGGRSLCQHDGAGGLVCPAAYSKLFVKALAVGTNKLYVASAKEGLGYVALDAQGTLSGPFQKLTDQDGVALGDANGVSAQPLVGGVDKVWLTNASELPIRIYECSGAPLRCTAGYQFGNARGFSDNRSGSPGFEAFLNPRGLVKGRYGDVFLADTGNHAIRRLHDYFVLTVGGTGALGNGGFGGAAISAALNEPTQPVVSANGDIYFADRGNHQIKKIACASNNVCTQVEQFNAATASCDVTAGYSADDKNPCTTDYCTPVATGNVPRLFGDLSCDDGNKCNGVDTCEPSGESNPTTATCVSSAPIVVLPDTNPCTADYCDRTLGEVHPPLPAGTACSTGNACKSMGTCNGAGSCVGIRDLSPNDDNVCTNDSCNAQTGVSHTPVAGSVPCGPASMCSAGVCQQSGASLGLPAHDVTVSTGGFAAFSGLIASGAGVQIDPKRAALVRGRVATLADVALSNVTVSVPGRPEFGSVKTNSSGEFLFVVNGGGPLTVRFELTDYLIAERQVQPEWGATVGIYSVFLLKPAANPTSITIGAGSSSSLAFSPKVTETVGGTAVSHRTAVFFPAGTIASSGQTSVQFQATEYTVGPQGAQAMPADIAQNTVYTYASEFSIVNGAEAVDFAKPVFAYVDNFLNLPAGTLVPSGFYDRAAHIWRAEASGCVVKVTANNGSTVTFDPSCDAHFTSLGADYAITTNELQKLAQTTIPDHPSGYPAGKTLWRVPLLHFSPHDFNFGARPPKCEKISQPGADCTSVTDSDCICAGAKGSVSGLAEPAGGSCQLSGSIIDAETQTLGERLPLEGTPFTLNYRSNSVPGYAWSRSVQLNFDGPTHSKLKEYRVRLSVAGQYREKTFPKSVTGPQVMTWDGLDAAGRRVVGTHKAIVEVGAVYPVVATNGARFMDLPAGALVQVDGADSRAQSREVVVWQKFYRELESRDAKGLGLGGWTVDAFHQYDPDSHVLYQGDGTRRVINADAVVSVAAGSGVDGPPSADDTPAGQAVLSDFNDIAIAPNGELHVALDSGIVQKVTTDGKIKRVAGVTSGTPAWQDGAPATTMSVGAHGIAFGPDGTLYITDKRQARQSLYRVDAAGMIHRIAGTGEATPAQCAAADGIPAISAPLCYPRSVSVGPDGSIYIESLDASGTRSTIKRIEPGANSAASGARITTFMGGGTINTDQIGANTQPRDVEIIGGQAVFQAAADGSLWVLGGYRHVYQVLPGGSIRVYANAGGPLECNRQRFFAEDLATAPNNGVILSNAGTGNSAGCGRRLSMLTQDDKVVTVAGGVQGNGSTVAGSLSLQTVLSTRHVAVGPDGAIYFADLGAHRVFKSSVPTPGGDLARGCSYTIPSEDRQKFFCFDDKGRHLKTFDAKTKALVFSFAPTTGPLSTITDADNRTTMFTPGVDKVAVQGPYGHTTTINLTNGYATSIVGATATAVTHDTAGLLTSLTPPGYVSSYTFAYDAAGRLRRDSDPLAGTQNFERLVDGEVSTVQRTTGLGKTSSFAMSTLAGGAEQRTITRTDRLQNTSVSSTLDGWQTSDLADGTKIAQRMDVDPRWGAMSLQPKERTVTIATESGNRTLSMLTTRCYTDDGIGGCPGPSDSSEIVSVNGRAYASTLSTSAGIRTYTVKTPMGRQTQYTLDDKGRVTKILPPGDATASGSAIQFTYPGGRLTTITQGSSRTTTLAYNAGSTGGASGHLASVSDPDANPATTTFESVNSLGLPATSTLRQGTTALGPPTAFSWDASGRLLTLTPPGKPVHALKYSEAGLLTRYTPPATADVPASLAPTHYDYSVDHDLELVRPPGTTVDYVYDPAFGRLIEVRSLEETVTLNYYPSSSPICSGCAPGRLQKAEAASSGHTSTFAYNGMLTRSIAQESTPLGTVTTNWTYDANFWPQTETVTASATASSIAFTYDNDGVLTCASAAACTDATKSFNVTPWTNSARSKDLKLDTIAEARTYNTFGELQSQLVTKASGVQILKIEYELPTVPPKPRDPFGRVTDRKETVNGITKTHQYVYDDFGRLFEVLENNEVVGHYEYDDNGNRANGTFWKNAAGQLVEGTYVYDNQDRLKSFASSGGNPSTTFEYTPAGALRRKFGSTFDYTFTYDATGGLRSARTPSGQIDYTLDAFGRRVSRSKNGSLERQWVYALGLGPVAELGADKKLTRRFVYASKRNVPDFMLAYDATGASTIYRILTDELGSVRLVVNTSTGAIQQELAYDAFGNVTKNTNPQFQPFGFAGGLYDVDTKLVRFGARDYDAEFGRWTNKDPILFAGKQTNLYLYVNADPVNRRDPQGLYGFFGGWQADASAWGFDLNYSSLGFAPFRAGSCQDGPRGNVEGFTEAAEIPPQIGVSASLLLGFFTGSGADLARAGGMTFTFGEGAIGGIRVITDGDHWGVALVGGAGVSSAPLSAAFDVASQTSFTVDPYSKKPAHCGCGWGK
jgi:RHS repeat-associated protein